MKKFYLLLICALIGGTMVAQEKVMRIYLANGKSEVKKLSDVVKVAIEDYVEPDWPEDPNPPMNGYLKSTFVEGELMYYGKDPQYSPSDCGVYFLYLKDLKNPDVSSSISFYVNVPRQQSGKFEFPEGTYTAETTWEAGTFNSRFTDKYNSNWNIISPQWVQYRVESGEFTVEKVDATTYTIKGRVKGGSMQDNGSILENEAGLEFSYTGKLPVTDYSDLYEEPEDPEPDQPEEPDLTDAVQLTTGELMYYGDSEYYLNLKDQRPTDTYEITLYLYSTPNGTLELRSGTYNASDTGNDLTFGTNSSSWTFIDHDFYDDRVRTNIKDGTVEIVSKGNHEYEIKGTVKGSADNETFSFIYSGTLPFEDYSY